jgi:hypothetical protein
MYIEAFEGWELKRVPGLKDEEEVMVTQVK